MASAAKGKIIAVVVLIIIIIAAGGVYYWYTAPKPTPPTPPPPGPPTKIIIGMVEPLSGTHAIFGDEAVKAAQLAIKHINEAGGIQSMGGATLELQVADSEDSVEGAKLATENLISTYHPPIILGAYISRHTMGMCEITEREKVILVADALVDELGEKGFHYFFRAAPRASAHGASAVEFIYECAQRYGYNLTTIAVCNEDSVFGRYVAQGAINKAEELGIEVVLTDEYPYDFADATPLVSEIMDANPDAVVFVPYFYDAILISKTIQELGFETMFFAGAGGCGFTDPDSIESAGEAVEYYTNTYSYNPAKPTPANQKFVSEFQELYGKIPTEAGGIAYYSMWVIKEGLEKAGEMYPDDPLDPEHLREAFASLDITEGPAAETYPSGRIAFDERGENIYAKTAVLQVIEGKPCVVWPFGEGERDPVFPRPGWSE